mgnify:CR=1 FL=1
MSVLKEYVEGAVSTESVKGGLRVNREFLENILRMHIATGNILDQVKKHAFYGREYDDMKIDGNLFAVIRSMEKLQGMTHDEISENEEPLIINPRIFHAIMGTATEAVELLEALDFDGNEMDYVNLGEEFGDLNWYQAIFCDASGIEWEHILKVNADKLHKSNKARYKNGFSNEDANVRNLDAEREVLDNLKIETK